MAYRYRTTTALFPLVPPPPRPVYPRGAVIRRFISTACGGFFLLMMWGLSLRQLEEFVVAALFAAFYAAPAFVCALVLVLLHTRRDGYGLVLAAASGAMVWLAVWLQFPHIRHEGALYLALLHTVAAAIALPPNSPAFHRRFKQPPAIRTILVAPKLRSFLMEKTTQKLVIIAVICAILLIAMQLFNGLVHDREHYAEIAQQNVATQADAYQARATLSNRLDLYRLTERSSKYAVLFLLITFGGCFLFETLRDLRVHPVQYTLVGAAICIFYLLLLSLGEHIGFTAAYLVAALACNGLITGYLSAVLGGMRRAAALGALLLAAYAVLYLLLQSQEYTLLIGSLLLFATLAGVMYGTRHFDWYDLKKREDLS